MRFHHTDITLLPPYERLFGPVTQARIIRLCVLYLALFGAGSAFLFLSHQENLRIFGMGLIVPGGGFLAHADICTQNGIGHLLAALAGVAAFGFSLMIWFGTGNILAPPLVWLGLAIGAATMRHGALRESTVGMVFAGLALAMSATAVAMAAWFALGRRQRRLDNAYLASQTGRLGLIFDAGIAPARAAEMSLEHLQRLRFALDRALQALDQFNGFEKIDQFQTAATRYQLNFLAYGVALTQARFTPAFRGYMHDAQIALLDKQAQHQVWSYWKLENLWGNLRADPDPVARENIMYTGFVALQMALFGASTGRRDFSETGRFTLTHPSGKRYAHDAASLVGRLEHEYSTSPYYLIACEPNWVYPLCNTIGASAIMAFDAQHQEQRWAARAQDFRHHLEAEFLDGFGRYVPCKSARTGLALPAIGGVMPLAMPCFFLNVIAPDLARRQWLLLRRQLFDRSGALRRRAFWPIDTGNYGFSRASAYCATALAAAELGDSAVYSACLDALEKECPSVFKDGVIHRRKASVWAHGVELMARAGARDGFRDVIVAPKPVTGPQLDSLAYPAILVASAHADHNALRAVLYADGVHAIGLRGLQANAHYLANGIPITANATGQARFDLALNGRTSLHVQPQGGG
ncbi:linalool dehydratase/isomerase domain-containing protein [Massilia pseudoviolaceinigra]|uniref:linalool dehydratase/isomerase domain-containing protein n=1 Tax=Massilia pseudoviolaceinigra TaxID=3057165 RepID=UPI002796D7EF|nr:hypothetical protein [Massilia sp. CCM 9206]MDQ1923521.1 hypothetical protein [Massilia sp. CCM 9206]